MAHWCARIGLSSFFASAVDCGEVYAGIGKGRRELYLPPLPHTIMTLKDALVVRYVVLPIDESMSDILSALFLNSRTCLEFDNGNRRGGALTPSGVSVTAALWRNCVEEIGRMSALRFR